MILAFQLSSGLRMPRDFHPDEVWTMTMLAKTVPNIFRSVLTEDNHPPLYYLVSKGWVSLIGQNILRLRILSFLFGCLTLVSFAWYFRHQKKGEAFFALGILGTNPLFNYYSSNVRPYALVIFLACVMTLSALNLRAAGNTRERSGQAIRKTSVPLYYGSAFLLGLTHYFGTLYVWVAVVLDLLSRRIENRPWRGFFLLAATGTWPVIQLIFGTLDQQKESNSWIKTVPIVSTVNNFLSGNFPLLMISKSVPQLSFGFVLALVLLLAAARPYWLFSDGKSNLFDSLRKLLSQSSFYLIALCASVLSTGVILDFILPFTTPYYFLVCLPAVIILLAETMGNNCRDNFSSSIVIFLVSSIAFLQILLNHVGLSNLKAVT